MIDISGLGFVGGSMLICFGTRPEYIKVKSLIDKLLSY
jgi:UDP-N-acetylglucosamine 2-epimerase